MSTPCLPDLVEDYFVLVKIPDHPKAYPSGYVPEQVLVAEKSLGRGLREDEDVKHINGKPKDNRPENLYVTNGAGGIRIGLSDESDVVSKVPKTFLPCRFQKQCWLTVRAPMARREKIYLPYVCSFQSDGDVYFCGRFWGFKEAEITAQEEQGEMEIVTGV